MERLSKISNSFLLLASEGEDLEIYSDLVELFEEFSGVKWAFILKNDNTSLFATLKRNTGIMKLKTADDFIIKLPESRYE
jgi:hypothetical protein